MPRAAGQPPAGFAGRVQQWQHRHGRHHLPWQGTRDPYRVWLSEVMLQQTQVATVLGHYERFLQRFPTVQDLAAAPQAEVLAQWSGLGYYSRARNLHRAAQVVVAEHGGRFPRSAQGLEGLPGIGRSTAAAIAAFCFGERAAILDGNVKRVLARAFAFDGDLASTAETAKLWQLAESLLPDADVESYTQGLMDLGAAICLARAPRCLACPVTEICAARAAGRPEAYPVKTRKLRRGARRHAWLLLRWRGQVWLLQRPQQGVWAGLWSLPEFDAADEALAALQGLPGQPQALPTIEHALTHFDWTLQPLLWPLPARLARPQLDALAQRWPEGRWVALDEALALGIPTPLRRLLQQQQQQQPTAA
ncbi:MAG: A/G-specific adenine glycosylase [Rubrivivax sp.]